MTLPHRPVRGSQTGRPIMALLDLLGRRWAMRILWELRQGPLVFRSLQEACGNVSPTILNTRLKELRQAALVTLEQGKGYRLTPLAAELVELVHPLNDWAQRWTDALGGDYENP